MTARESFHESPQAPERPAGTVEPSKEPTAAHDKPKRPAFDWEQSARIRPIWRR